MWHFSPLPADLQHLPLDQQKVGGKGRMKETCQPHPLSLVFVKTASSASKAFGAFSQQETKMLFFSRHNSLGPPQAVGPVHRPLESFIFIYIPSFQTPLNN